jgi:hypothetical protein
MYPVNEVTAYALHALVHISRDRTFKHGGVLEKRTSVAEAVKRQTVYGTAEAVPFV